MQISKINFFNIKNIFLLTFIFLFGNKLFAKNIFETEEQSNNFFADIFRQTPHFHRHTALDAVSPKIITVSQEILKQVQNDGILVQNENKNHEALSQKANSASNKQPLRLPLWQFRNADMQRYMLAGGTPLIETKIKPVPFAIFSTALVGAFIVQHEMQMNTIWQNQTAFKFQDDALEELWLDKFGHFYGVYANSYLFREILLATGFGWNAANNWGAILGTLYSGYVEVLDGFGEQWGFSPSDFLANCAGGLFFAAQNYFPALQNITPKFHYIPSEWFGYQSRQPHEIFIDDYSSQAYFFSLNIHNMMPDSWSLKQYYPSWLELSIGYVMRNGLVLYQTNGIGVPCSECISLKEGAWGSPRLVLALDYNMVKLLPDGGNTWNWFKQTLNLLKFPSPALEIGKVTRFYLMFPFKIL